MIIEPKDRKVDAAEHKWGGYGTTITKTIVDTATLPHCRVLGVIELEPGSGIGYHVHNNEAEVYYILEGRAKVNDNNEKECILKPGDTLQTNDGMGHSIEAVGEETLKFVAVVITNG